MTAAKAAARDVAAEVAFLTRALKALALRESVTRLAARSRAESWSHEEFLIACLQREVSARESLGGEGRIRAARFPSRKSLEDFGFDHARGLKREVIAHLGTLDRKSTRLNSSHVEISYAVFCLKKKKKVNRHAFSKKQKKKKTQNTQTPGWQ